MQERTNGEWVGPLSTALSLEPGEGILSKVSPLGRMGGDWQLAHLIGMGGPQNEIFHSLFGKVPSRLEGGP